MTQQYLRKVSLIAGNSDTATDLSEMHFRFLVKRGDVQTPNSAEIRIYNLSESTAKRVQKEFSRVVLQAGYGGNFGKIFDGTIKQVRRGRENATDTYLDITAADGDFAYNFAVVNTSLAAGATPADCVKAAARAMGPYGITEGYIPALPATGLPRGKVIYGMARDVMRAQCANTDTTWSMQNGKLELVPLTGYLPGQAIVLTSKTGLIGMPEQTQDGIKVKCLLNPNIKIGGRVQISNRSIQQYKIDLAYSAINFVPNIADDGFYRVIVSNYSGDTRGQDWYNDMVCLAINDAVPVSLAVKGYG